MLNTDYNLSNKVNIVYGECIAELDIGSCEIALAYIAADIVIVPLDTNVAIQEMSWTDSELSIVISGTGDHTLKVFSEKNPVYIKLNEKSLNFKTGIGFTDIDLSMDGCNKLKLNF